MESGENTPRLRTVKLCEHRGEETSIFIDAEISEDGTLVVSGQDVGKAPIEYWGDSDYEYWVHVAPEHKARLLDLLKQQAGDNASTHEGHAAEEQGRDSDEMLLILMKKVYGGNLLAVSALTDLLKTHEIPYVFDSWA